MRGAAEELPFNQARQAILVPVLENVTAWPTLFAGFQVVPPSLVTSMSTLVPVGSHVITESSVTSLIPLESVSVLEVTVAEIDEGVPIQSAALLPVVMIFRFVAEVGQ